MSEDNTCVTEPNLIVLPLTYCNKGLVSFLLKKVDNDVRVMI